MEIGEKIKRAREQHELTQAQLAEKLTVSRSTISGWEVGRNIPDLGMIIKISDLFGLSLDQLLREETEMVRKIDRQLKFGRGAKIMAVLSVMVLLGFFSFGRWQEYRTQHQSVVPVAQISDIQLIKTPATKDKLAQLTVTGQAALANKQQVVFPDMELHSGVLYLAFYEKPTLFAKKATKKQPFEFDLSTVASYFEREDSQYEAFEIKQVIIVSGIRDEESPPGIFNHTEEKIVYQK